jgi:hypothetical protein
LAPLDEEAPKAAPKVVEDKPASDVLVRPAADATPKRPQKSLIEEEFDSGWKPQAELQKPPVRRREGEFDPLRPPGFSGPSYGTPAWVFVAVGLGVVAVIGVVVAVLALS